MNIEYSKTKNQNKIMIIKKIITHISFLRNLNFELRTSNFDFRTSSFQLRTSTSGFAILFAVLLSSFLITLGISIFSISLKEIQMTTSLRDSQIAYYIADSARECALYWDIKQGKFPRCIDTRCENFEDINGNLVPATSPFSVDGITCNGISKTLSFTKDNLTYSSDYTIDFFQASSTSSSTPISDIKIKKGFFNPNTKTTIEARGHNTGIFGRRVERGIQTINNN